MACRNILSVTSCESNRSWKPASYAIEIPRACPETNSKLNFIILSCGSSICSSIWLSLGIECFRSKYNLEGLLNFLDFAVCRRRLTIWFGWSIYRRVVATVLGVHYEWMYWEDERGCPPYGWSLDVSLPQNLLSCQRGAQSDHPQSYIATILCHHNPRLVVN